MTERITVGDKVRVATTPLTSGRGLAGSIGQVYGHTTPSVTGVDVLGVLNADYALNVYFEEIDESLWLAEELLEFLDHGAGTTMELRLKTGPRRWVRTTEGGWDEEAQDGSRSSEAPLDVAALHARKWWRFW